MTQWLCQRSRTSSISCNMPNTLGTNAHTYSCRHFVLCMRGTFTHTSESTIIHRHTYILYKYTRLALTNRSTYLSLQAHRKRHTQIISFQCQMCHPHTNTEGLIVCPHQSQEVSLCCFLSPRGGCVPANKGTHHPIEHENEKNNLHLLL